MTSSWRGTASQRLQAALVGEKPDRPPVICPGGMMSAFLKQGLENSEGNLQRVNQDGEALAGLARKVQKLTGFENFGLPFCMTLEAEVLGAVIDYGSTGQEPHVGQRPYADSASVPRKPIGDLLAHPRVTALSQAVEELSKDPSRLSVTVSLLGPITLASSLVEVERLFKDFRKDPEGVEGFLAYLTDFLLELSALLVQKGAPVIVIADPTATGEILGPRMFRRFALPHLQRLHIGIAAQGALPILHICGNVEAIAPLLKETEAAAFSADAMVSLRGLKEHHGVQRVMGNISIRLLHDGPPEKISAAVQKLLDDGVDIIAPACGLVPESPAAHIQALTGVVIAK